MRPEPLHRTCPHVLFLLKEIAALFRDVLTFLPPGVRSRRSVARAVLASLLSLGAVRADVYTVTTSNANGAGSLSTAWNSTQSHPGPDEIVFDIPGGGASVISLPGPLAPLNGDAVTITGPTDPARRVTISRAVDIYNPTTFWIYNGVGTPATLTLRHLNISNPNSWALECIDPVMVADLTFDDVIFENCAGPAFRYEPGGGSLTMDRCIFRNNGDSNPYGSHNGPATSFSGGATVMARNCAWLDNETGRTASALAVGGGSDWPAVTLVNCTISGNRAPTSGAIFHLTGTLDLINCTVTENRIVTLSSPGQTIFSASVSVSTLGGILRVGNSVIAGNYTPLNTLGPDFSGTGTSLGHNVIGIRQDDNPPWSFTSGFTDGVMADKVGTPAAPLDARLDARQTVGVPIPGHRPRLDSPAFDAGDDALVTSPTFSGPPFVDQWDLPRITSMHVDAGAVEADASNYNPIRVISTADNGAGTLRNAVATALANGDDEIFFDEALFGPARQTITLTTGEIPIAGSLKIVAPAVGLVISGNDASRVFNITVNNQRVELENLSLVHGSAAGDGGALVCTGAEATVSLKNCSVEDSHSTGRGGGVHFQGIRGVINGCSILSNAADTHGGGIAVQLAQLFLTNSTVGDNLSDVNGGGIHIAASQVRIVNATIVENTCGSPIDAPGDGGGIFRTGLGNCSVGNSIVAHNLDYTGQAFDVFGTFVSLGHNLIGRIDGIDAGGGTPFQHGVNGDIVGSNTAPRTANVIGPTANGGLTKTYALLLNSAAIDAGDASLLLDAAWPAYPLWDQRGQIRAIGGIPDMGAFEYPTGPKLQILATDASAVEAGRSPTGAFRVQRSSATGEITVTIERAASSTATAADFRLLGQGLTVTTPGQAWSLTMGVGQTSATLIVSPIDDSALEGTETVVLGIASAPAGFTLDTPAAALRTVSLADDELLVTSAADSGAGTLRDALAQAAARGTGTIRFDTAGTFSTPQTIALNTAGLSFTGSTLALLAPAQTAQRVTIDGGGAWPGLVCTPSGSTMAVTLKNLTFAHCRSVAAGQGGAVSLTNADATVSGCQFQDGTATGGPGAIALVGCGLKLENCSFSRNQGTTAGALRLENGLDSTFAGCCFNENVSTGDGGAVTVANSPLQVTNCTVSGNRAAGAGGGIAFQSTTLSSTLIHCTVAANRSNSGGTATGAQGGGVRNLDAATPAAVSLTGSIVAGNLRGTGSTADDLRGPLASLGYNLVGNATGATAFVNGTNGDLVGVAANLAPLRNNGGPTPTHALLCTSPAVDAGLLLSAIATDQRGMDRAFGVAPDIGAYELQPETYNYWAAHTFAPGGDTLPDADPDADGVPSGLEYAMGTDPQAQSSFKTLTVSQTPSGSTVTVPFSPLAHPSFVETQISSNLTSWSPISAASLTDSGPTPDGLAKTYSGTLPGGRQWFVRMKRTP